jgi:hypothetical protein
MHEDILTDGRLRSFRLWDVSHRLEQLVAAVMIITMARFGLGGKKQQWH